MIMAKTTRITLATLLTEKNITIIDRQPASMVPPKYRSYPKDKQVKSGVAGIDEVLLSNEETVFICIDDELVFATAPSASAHRNGLAHHVRKPKTELKELDKMSKEDPSVGVPNKQEVLQKTQTKADSEPTYGKLKKQLEMLTCALQERGMENEQLKELVTALKWENELLLDTNKDFLIRLRLLESDHIPEWLALKFLAMLDRTVAQMYHSMDAAITLNADTKDNIDKLMGTWPPPTNKA
jgi:hypothetical protein